LGLVEVGLPLTLLLLVFCSRPVKYSLARGTSVEAVIVAGYVDDGCLRADMLSTRGLDRLRFSTLYLSSNDRLGDRASLPLCASGSGLFINSKSFGLNVEVF